MKSKNANKEIIYLDLFSGVGGFCKGFEDARLPIKHHYFSEIDKHAIAVYKHQFKHANYVGSVTDVSGTELRNKHPKGRFIITFGFPCQDLSIAGKGKGLDGARSGLFFEAIRLVREIKPEVFIFENVKGLLSSNEGKDFETVLRTIADLGLYECEWQLVNTAWVLPQNRERVYFIGHLVDRSKPRVFPFRKTDIGASKGKSKTATIRTITAGGNSGGHHSGMTLVKQAKGSEQQGVLVRNMIQTVTVRKYPVDIESLKKCLKKHKTISIKEISKRLNVKKTKVEHWFRSDKSFSIPDREIWYELKRLLGITTDEFDKSITEFEEKENVFEKSNRFYDSKGISPCLTSASADEKIIIGTWRTHKDGKGFREVQSGNCPTIPARAREDGSGQPVIKQDTEIRRLTEIECERLQGFPDNWTKYGDYDGEIREVSKTQRYKQMGNAVTTDWPRMIAERLFKTENK